MVPISPQLFWYDAVQIVMLAALVIGFLWLAKTLISHGNRLTALETIITNHYSHRFAQIGQHLNIDWKDTDDE